MAFQLSASRAASKSELYEQLASQLSALLAGEGDLIANAANCASLIFHSLPDLNWAGFYFAKAGDLVLGPFQGKPACVRIKIGQGVCGAAAAKCETLIVSNKMFISVLSIRFLSSVGLKFLVDDVANNGAKNQIGFRAINISPWPEDHHGRKYV